MVSDEIADTKRGAKTVVNYFAPSTQPIGNSVQKNRDIHQELQTAHPKNPLSQIQSAINQISMPNAVVYPKTAQNDSNPVTTLTERRNLTSLNPSNISTQKSINLQT